MADNKGKSVIRQVVAIGIGAAIFVALTTVQIPVGFVPNTALQVRAAVLIAGGDSGAISGRSNTLIIPTARPSS